MKQPVFFIFCCLIILPGQAQTTGQKSFLDALNRLVTNTTQHHWRYDVPIQADSLFHLNGDALSITWNCTVNGSHIRIRLETPISKIQSVDWDHYLVLHCGDEKLVRVYEQKNGHNWQLLEEGHLLHVGTVSEKSRKEMKMKRKIEEAFELLNKQKT